MEEYESSLIPFYSDKVIEDALDLFIEGFEEDEQASIAYKEKPALFSSGLPVPVSAGESNDSTTVSAANPAPFVPEPNMKATRKFVDILQEERVTKIRKVHGRLSALQFQQARRKETLPRSLRNSIHSAYPLMLMNAINSADLLTVQNFFNAFMSGPCTFMVSVRADWNHGLPKTLNAFGPQLFTHYLLGCFVSFPDMAVKMHDSRALVTGGRTRIVIGVTICGTKILDIPEYEWAPDLERMPELYCKRGEGDVVTPLLSSNGSDCSVSLQDVETSIDVEAGVPDNVFGADANIGGHTVEKNNKNRRTMKLPMIIPSAANVAAAQRVPRIPQEYVAATVEHARMLPYPNRTLCTKGSMTLFLDENNSMQHLQIDSEQIRGAANVPGGR